MLIRSAEPVDPTALDAEEALIETNWPVMPVNPPEAVISKSDPILPVADVMLVDEDAIEPIVPEVKLFTVPVMEVEAVNVVNAPVEAVPDPIAPGAAKVAPLKDEALRLATLVVEATTNGAVPVAKVEVS
jgi:hypothetical protein